MGKTGSPPDPATAAISGIKANQELQPFNYLIQAASTLGKPITIDGKTYDFSGLGTADTAGKVSDQMASTLLALQKEKDPAIIQQRIDELKTADPQGYAARQAEFDKILDYSKANPGVPLSNDLQTSLQDDLAKGAGFDDARQAEQVREQTRGGQVSRGIYLGNAATSQEAQDTVKAGESIQSQRQQNALQLLESGQDPNNLAYQKFEQTLHDLGAFENQQTPEAQFRQVGAASNGPVQMVGGAPTANFDPNAASQGLNNYLNIYQGQLGYNSSQANPFLSGLGIGGNYFASVARQNPQWFTSNPAGFTPGNPANAYENGPSYD